MSVTAKCNQDSKWRPGGPCDPPFPTSPPSRALGPRPPLTGAPAGWPCCPVCPPALSSAPPAPRPGLASASQPCSSQPVLSPGPPAGLRCGPPAPGSSSGRCSSEQFRHRACQRQVTRIKTPEPEASAVSQHGQNCFLEPATSVPQIPKHVPPTSPRYDRSLLTTVDHLEVSQDVISKV